METQSQKIAKMVESGAYFEESRGWYRAMYIGPIAERTFFLIIAIMAGLVAFFGFLSVLVFLPVTDRPGIIIANNEIDENIPYLLPIKQKGEAIRPALQRFFVATYVLKRESYDADGYAANYYFIQAQSDAPTFAGYVAQDGNQNPQSPVATLGAAGKRFVGINSVAINDLVDPKVATVNFTTETHAGGEPVLTNWTATLQFYYSDLIVNPATDPKTGRETLKTQDPQFQVVNYAVTQTP